MDAINDQYERYSRQRVLPGLGEEGQQKLALARVLIVGAGGLGCPVIQYLSAAGVGTIGIIDGDKVEMSNLHRQVLYTIEDIGKHKAMIAAAKVNQTDPQINCRSYPYPVSNKNAFDLINEYDIVLDCTDNFVSRYVLSDACRLLGKPLVFAAVFQYEGQVTVFNLPPYHTSYRDLFPEAPDPASVPDCNQAGVLGVLPGMIGILQATETIKIITGIGEILSGKLLHYDLRTHSSMIIEISRGQQQTGPATREAFESMDYEWFCGSTSVPSISKQELAALITDANTIVIDVRELNELPDAGFTHKRVPLSTFDSLPDLSGFHNIVVFCQSGTRSVKAAGILKEKYGPAKQVSHLQGGLAAYNRDAI